jgi:hypothetical protein
VIPQYMDTKMTPFKTNQEKEIERTIRDEKKAMADNMKKMKEEKNPETFFELKINQPQFEQKQPSQTTFMNQIYPSPYVPVPNPYYPYGQNFGVPWQYTPNNVPIINRYNISLGNGNGDITRIASLYEDILPSENNISNNTFNTLKERMIIHHYIRSMFIKTGDGEELYINGGKNNSSSEVINLLSHVKLLEINPYHYNKLTENPYKTLPTNFVMYRSCYPIKMGKYNNVECSKSSIGMNVRIYLLSKYEDSINTSERLIRYNSDVWRELDYYQFIREEIIKQNVSPNFITIHSYYMTKNTGINFKKFDSIKSKIETKNLNIDKINSSVRNNQYILYIKQMYYDDPREVVTFNDLIRHNIVSASAPNRVVLDSERKKVIDIKVDNLMKENRFNHFMDSDKCLVMLSEAPTQLLLNWARRTYQEKSGPIKTMIQNGYHHDKVWESVFFQLLLSMLIMFDKKIMFSEFSLENNVYIKDLRHNEQNVGIWKYIYNGIEYYVPNYGYLLLIDSNFGELLNDTQYILSPTYDPTRINHKIKSTLLSDSNANGEIYKLCLERMINVFNRNNFGNSFNHSGGVPPTNSFLNKLDAITEIISAIKEEYFGPGAVWNGIVSENRIKEEMRRLPMDLVIRSIFTLVHSRIGTALKDNETGLRSAVFDANTKVGSIIVKTITPNLSTFGIFLGQTGVPLNPLKILTTNNPIISFEDRQNARLIEEVSDGTNIFNYYGTPEHSYEPGKQYNLLETYLISVNQ